MTKTELINDVMFEMGTDLTREQLDRLKITLIVKMKDYEVTEIVSLPSTIVYDNEWLLKRYLIDGIAAGTKESTIRQYIRAVKALLSEIGKNYTQITGQDITDYLALRQYRDHISINYKATLNRYFSSFWQWAYRKHHIEQDIMRDVDKVKTVQKRKERLTDEEVEDARDACESIKERALIELMLSTGMRVGEIAALNLSDLDLQHKRINIFGIKTNTYRTGMLTTRAVKALRAYIVSRPYCTDALFISDRKPHGRLPESSIETVVKKIAERAGIERINTTVHTLRKTFASVLYRKTKDVLLVSKLLGHANTDVTVKYYLVDDVEDLQYRYNMVQ